MFEFMFYAIIITAILFVAFSAISIYTAYLYGGEFKIIGNHGHRKGFLERILDGLEITKEF